MKYDKLTDEFINNHGKYCSSKLMSWWQSVFYLTVVSVLLLLLAYRWDYFLCLFTILFSSWYFVAAIYRFYTSLLSLTGRGMKKISADTISQLKDQELPVYTILLPLYKEANIADKIIDNMNSLDYPTDKLDIKLLLEADDSDTIKAVEECNLPPCYDVIIVPDSKPKTKPRACNYGLAKAKGEFCVIYDAEDRPDNDQLKKVVSAFNGAPDSLACIQAKLNYYNPDQNLLTKWFTIEYSTTFDLYLPGLESLNVPIPLGGTSNHFKTDILKEIGGWDPFNVTEDCDLGVRIYKKGYRTCLVDSTTWEEANSMLWNWVRQRSRWIKGFFQTHLTHMRHPLLTLKSLGVWGLLGFYLSVGSSAMMMLLNIFYWGIGSLYIYLMIHALQHNQHLWGDIIKGPHKISGYEGVDIFGFNIEAWPFVYIGPHQDPFWSNLSIVFFIISCILLSANLMFIIIHCLACIKRRYYRLLPWAILMPFYWLLISIGAWKGFIQLFTNPFYWEKTKHGLDHVNDNQKIEL